MAKNLGREFATMSDDERRKFALEDEEGSRELPAELAFDNPRDEEHMGRHSANPDDDIADPENRDGMSALLDERQRQGNLQDSGSAEESATDNSTGTDDR